MHKHVIRYIAKYLVRTSTYVDLPDVNRRFSICGVVYKPDKETFTECYVDAKFSGGWSQSDADNAETFMLHTLYVITYVGCPVLWCSKWQTEIALSKTEANIYSIEPGNAQRNTFNGYYEGSIIYFWYSSSKAISFLWSIQI